MQKNIAVLGATGSVGMQALDVIRARGYRVSLITAGSRADLAENICREFKPDVAVMADERAALQLKSQLSDTSVRVLSSEAAICEAVSQCEADAVVNSILGKAGLMPTLAVLDSGKRLALANKESLVIAGKTVMERAGLTGAEIIPVDSEHSAIFQSLKSGRESEIKRILLTASGGPFYGKTRDELASVTLKDTLAHPTWRMGKKITVDSATLMNKGFEIVEAAHLFGISPERIKVLVHRESILHSAIEYIDNSVIGEFSVPDMRSCVQYALDYPNREESVTAELDLIKIGALTFSEVDSEAFPLISLAPEMYSKGGAMCAVMNAADEIAADAFLTEKIGFNDISEVVITVCDRLSHLKSRDSLEDILEADGEARRVALEEVNAIRRK